MSVDGTNPTSSAAARILSRPCLEDVLATSRLAERPARDRDHAGENRALAALASAMVESPEALLRQLVDCALRLTGADSAGVSLLEAGGGGGDAVFRWAATAGRYGALTGTTLPRDASPCGTVLDRNATQLMADPARFYPRVADLDPGVVEVLLVPFYRGDTPVGTVSVVAQTPAKRSHTEDVRLVESLARFRLAAVEALSPVDAHRRVYGEVERQARIFDTTLSTIADFA